MILIRSEVGDIEYLYGVTKDDFIELKYCGHLQAYQRKIVWGKELLELLLHESILIKDHHRIQEVKKAIEWNEARIKELM